MSAAYYFGRIGLSFSTGIAPGSFSNKALTDFMIQRKYQQLQPGVSKSNPLNSYFLFGPAFSFGERIVLNAELQGGLFLNDPGALSIRQQGVDRALYSFVAGQKKTFPGFGGNISIGYPINSSTLFFINGEYLQSQTSVRIMDIQQGIDNATQQTRGMKLVNIGIGIRKSFTGKKEEPAGRKHAINTKGTGATNGRMMNQDGCGPVTVKKTNSDGTIEERTFSCPLDAVNYDKPQEKTQQRTGDRDPAARNIISGTLTWVSPTNNDIGIITNNNITAAGKQTPNTSFGEKVKIGIRESVTGKKKALKEYGIIFADQGNAYISPLGSGNENPQYQNDVVNSNPLYEQHGSSGDNPLFEGNRAHTNPYFQGNSNAGTNTPATNPLYQGTGNAGNNPLSERKGIQENGLRGIQVMLIDSETGQTVASTTTSAGGDFFFANVPDGAYVVQLRGTVTRQKGYDLTANKKIDLLGNIQHSDEQLRLRINTAEGGMEQKAGISTSRSNVRTRSISLVEADLDSDGDYESTKVIMELSDGTIHDVTADARTNTTSSVNKVTVKGWDPVKKHVATDDSHGEYTVSSGAGSDGFVMKQGNVSQVVLMVDRSGDPLALDDQKIKTKSNIKNDRLMSHSDHDTAYGISGFTKILNQSIADIDGDGSAETVIGNDVPEGSVPPGAMMRPGGPIGGIIVKGGKNPGGNLRSVQTNDNGEFAFNRLEAGNYRFLVQQKIVIADESVVVLESKASARKGWDGTVKGGSIVAESMVTERKGWDGTVKGGSIAAESMVTERKGWDGTVKGNGKMISEYITTLNELDQLLTVDNKSPRADIRVAKENSARLRDAIQQLDSNSNNVDTKNAMMKADTNFAILLGSVNRLGSEYRPIANTLKTKHDTAKNSVGNIR
jgi:hypothetical protein